MSTLNTPEIENLFEAILSLQNLEESKDFFRDLLTEKEIQEFSSRWQVAQMLWQNISYSTIEKETGMSSTTIARISKWLNDGEGGYNKMLDRLYPKNSAVNTAIHHTSKYDHRE
jgi:TrpR-related protein YerC/YecD